MGLRRESVALVALGLGLLSLGCSKVEVRDVSVRDLPITVTTRSAVLDGSLDRISCSGDCPAELRVHPVELGNVVYPALQLSSGCAIRFSAPVTGAGEIAVRIGLYPYGKQRRDAPGVGLPAVVMRSSTGAGEQVLSRLELRSAVDADPRRGWYRMTGSFSFPDEPGALVLGIEPEPGRSDQVRICLADVVVSVREQRSLTLDAAPLPVRVPERFRALSPVPEAAGDLFQRWARARRCLSLLLAGEKDEPLAASAMLSIASELEQSFQHFSAVHSEQLFWQLWQLLPAEVVGGPQDHPDIILVVLDAARRDHLSCYGYHRPTTPALDSVIAARGVRFSHAYSTGTCTNASMPTMMTGQYPTYHLFSFAGMQLPSYVTTLAERLRGHGYATLGVTSNPYLGAGSGMGRGYQSYDTLERYYLPYPKAEHVVDRALEHLPLLRWAPVFLSLHVMDCHGPYKPPSPYEARFDGVDDSPADQQLNQLLMPPFANKKLFHLPLSQRSERIDMARLHSLYDGGVRYADDQLGRLLEQLEQLGLLHDTAILVIADHGEELLEHGFSYHNYIPHEEKVAIPFLLKPQRGAGLPRGITVDARVDAVISLVPTVLDLAALPQPSGLPGHSLLPLVRGEHGPADEVLYLDNEWIQAVRRGPWKLISATSLREERRRSPDHVLAGGLDDLLFNLADDPGEQHNLIAREPKIAAELREILAGRLAEIRDQRRSAREDSTMQPRTLDEQSRRRLEALGYVIDPVLVRGE